MHEYTILKREDVEKYLSPRSQYRLEQMLYAIDNGRKADKKPPMKTFDAEKGDSKWFGKGC